MITMTANKIDFSVAGKSIRTLATAYGKQKQQKCNYIKIVSGTVGVVKCRQIKLSDNNEYYFIKFLIEGQTFYCKLARTMIEFI